MDRTDEVGAAAAAEYFLRLYAYVNQSGRVEEWDRVTTRDCGFCSTVRENVTAVFAQGGRYQGGDIALGEATTLGYDAVLRIYAVEVEFVLEEIDQVDADGSVLHTFPVEQGMARLEVFHGPEGWEIFGANTGEVGP